MRDAMARDSATQSDRYPAPPEQVQVLLWTFAPAYLLLHGIIATCLPAWLDPLSSVFIVLAELVAIGACVIARRRAGTARMFWVLLIGAIVVHSAAMSLDVATEIAQLPVLNHIGGVQIFLSMLYGVPLLVAVSIQNDPRVRLVGRVIHASLSIAIGAALYLQIFRFLTVYGSPNSSDAVLVTDLFDAIDFFLAAAATTRWLGSIQDQERRFFRILTIFLWMNAVLPAVHNRILVNHDYVWLDLLISAPYVVLVPLILTARSHPRRSPSPVFVRAVRTGSPMFLAGALVLVGVIASRSHFYFGLAAALFAIVGYGALNIVVHSRVLETEESLMASKVALEKLVDLDGLTGIANRRAYDEALHREFAASSRSKQPVSLLMIDVDLFKDLNDAKGHVAGDEYLVRIAEVLRLTLRRTTDFVARYGGEEFSAILPATDGAGAVIAAEKVRKGVAELGLSHPESPSGILTVSIGISTFEGAPSFTPAALIETADRALYMAKRRGRNCSVFHRMDSANPILTSPTAR
jgi:diguanylate cyclase (GGDEF)-like protein